MWHVQVPVAALHHCFIKFHSIDWTLVHSPANVHIIHLPACFSSKFQYEEKAFPIGLQMGSDEFGGSEDIKEWNGPIALALIGGEFTNKSTYAVYDFL